MTPYHLHDAISAYCPTISASLVIIWARKTEIKPCFYVT